MIKIGKKEVKNFGEPYVIAEIGANFNGDLDLAKKIIDAACDCGCDAIKFQSWSKDSLFSKTTMRSGDQFKDDIFGTEKLSDLIEKLSLTEAGHRELFNYANKKKIDFLSSAFSKKEVDLLNNLGVKAFKVASMDLNNLDLLRYMAEQGKPIILSTGMGTMAEIDEAIQVINEAGNDQLILLHCVSIYPPKDEGVHLNNITMLRNVYSYPVGYSDHTLGSSISLAAVAMGACVIEKHFTLDKTMPGWDHAVSADPQDMKTIVTEGKRFIKAHGSYERVVAKEEMVQRKAFRRSALAARDLTAGHVLLEEDITYKRPGSGIQPKELKYILGRKIKRNIAHDELFAWQDFE